MARDYARNRYRKQTRPNSPRRKKRRTNKRDHINPFLLSATWLVIGLLIGSFGSTLLILQHPQQTQVTKETTQTKPTLAENKTQKPSESAPQFDFYTILPEKHIEVQKKKEEKQVTQAPTQQYLLQVASVKENSDADRLKAQLSLLGFTVYVSEPKNNDSKWYRVNVGPFKTLTDAQKQQKRLRVNKLNSLLIKMKPLST